MTCKKPFVLMLCLVAFLSVILTPACLAMSGQSSFIEICTSFGTLERISVDGDEPQDKQVDTQRAFKNACAFCLHDKLAKSVSCLYPREELIENLSAQADDFQEPALDVVFSPLPSQYARAPPVVTQS